MYYDENLMISPLFNEIQDAKIITKDINEPNLKKIIFPNNINKRVNFIKSRHAGLGKSYHIK